LLRAHAKGTSRSWINRLRQMHRLSRLRLEQWRDPLEDRYYDGPPLPSLLVAFKDRDATVAEQAREWKIAVEQAENVAKLAGKLPAGVTRSLEQSQAAGVDWRELLRRAWSETIPSDYSWTPPNRRHIWAGLYLPGVRSEGAGEIAIAVDCSGSVNARQLGLFEGEIRSILEGQRPSHVHVLYFDTEVHKAEVYQAGQPIMLTPVGGGGTNFAPCFRWLDERGIVPQTLVFLTDLCGAFPREAPAYPVLWASTQSRRAPFGQVIPMEAA
jgi:predicted metal-dependent peptidase